MKASPLLIAPDDWIDATPRPPVGRLYRHAALTFGAFVLVFGGWSAAAPLTKAAIAPGVVEAIGKRRVVQHLEGGIIREIHVRENEFVRAGQPLVRLDEVQSGASQSAARAEYLALVAEVARLEAETSGAREISFPSEVSSAAAEAAVADIISGQRSLFSSRRDSLAAQTRVLEETAAQARAEIRGLEAQVASQSDQADLLQSEMDAVKQLVEEQLEHRSRFLNLQRQLASANGSIGSLTGQIARARQSIAEAGARIEALRAARRDEATASLREARTRLDAVRERLRSATDVNARRIVTAAVDGQVVNIRFSTVGGVVRPGEAILDIAPQRESMIVTARVRPTDIEHVHAGLPAKVNLIAYSSRRLPMLAGRLISVAQDVQIDEQSGESYFLAKIQIDDASIMRDAGVILVSGMPADVFIEVGERTLLQYVVQPITDSFNRAFREI